MAATALTSFGDPLQSNNYAEDPPFVTGDDLIKTEYTPSIQPNLLLESPPQNVLSLAPAQVEQAAPPQPEEGLAPVFTADQPVNHPMMATFEDQSASASAMAAPSITEDFTASISADMANSVQQDLDLYEAEEAASVPTTEPMQAYAKLQFSDGDFYVSTQAVELGRDIEAEKLGRRLKHKEKRGKQREPVQQEFETPYKPVKLPQPSYAGSISNYSESGGIIGAAVYSGSEEEFKPARRRRRRLLTSNDSSHSQSQNIAPASLHTNPHDPTLSSALFGQVPEPPPLDPPFVPIHTGVDRSISGISRKHILIAYSSEEGYWELHVQGRNGAFLDDEYIAKGASARLRHGSQITVQGIDIVFKLPDNARDEEVEDDQGSAGSESELSQLDSDLEAEKVLDGDSDAGSEVEDSSVAPKERVKIKLNLSKRGQALKEKDKKGGKQPSKAVKEPVKEEKPLEEEDTAEPIDVMLSIEEEANEEKPKVESAGVPATPAADLPPGSILAGLAPEEIPQKRKGPGRPPKNGVMSKRDEAIIKRKKKEYQKAGKEIPPLSELLAMARAEAGSTRKPDELEGGEGGVIGTGIGTSTGVEGSGAPADGSAKSQTTAEIEAAKARKQAKSPSPQKPESEYTEEELKKPQKTYVVLIHDALSASTTGVMDLQQIYDAIQKMYPYYKYRSQTQGWQSSIRHNLIGSEAFEEAGKIGKGRLWKINPNYPIDKEKKRRAPTPPTDKPAYPYYQNGQYNQQGYPAYRPSPYGTPYGPPQTTLPNGARPPPSYGQQRPGTYYSPYASNPGGQTHQSPYGAQARPPYAHAHAPNQPNATPNGPPGNAAPGSNANATRPAGNAPGQPPAQANGQPQQRAPGPAPRPGQPQGQPQQAPIGNDDTIEEIMSYHKRYLGQFKVGVDQDRARDLFRKAVSRHIDQNKNHGEFSSPEEKVVADTIGEIIKKNRGKPKAPVQQQGAQPARPLNGAQPNGAPAASQSPAPQNGQPRPAGSGTSTPVQPGQQARPPVAQGPPPAGSNQAPIAAARPVGPPPPAQAVNGTAAPQPRAASGTPVTIDLTAPAPAQAQAQAPVQPQVQGPAGPATAQPQAQQARPSVPQSAGTPASASVAPAGKSTIAPTPQTAVPQRPSATPAPVATMSPAPSAPAAASANAQASSAPAAAVTQAPAQAAQSTPHVAQATPATAGVKRSAEAESEGPDAKRTKS